MHKKETWETASPFYGNSNTNPRTVVIKLGDGCFRLLYKRQYIL